MQNLWLKRCKCGRVAVEFRSRKDLYVDSVRQVYCPRCLKEAKPGSLIVDIRKWGSSTSKDSDTGVYGFLYNKDAILRRNKDMKWKDDEVIEVFETGMVRPNLLSIMREGKDYHIRGILKEGENPLDYKKKKGSYKKEESVENISSTKDGEFDGVFYDTPMEEPLDHIAGKDLSKKKKKQETSKNLDEKNSTPSQGNTKQEENLIDTQEAEIPNVQRESFDLFKDSKKEDTETSGVDVVETSESIGKKKETTDSADSSQVESNLSDPNEENPEELLNKIKDNLQLDSSSNNSKEEENSDNQSK